MVCCKAMIVQSVRISTVRIILMPKEAQRNALTQVVVGADGMEVDW